MARPKFKIDNKIDKRNFLKYLENNRDKVLSAIKSINTDDMPWEEIKSLETVFVTLWERITSATYILDTPIEKYFEDLTTLLYMLPESTISKIRSSLRANRKSSTDKGKVQLTIDKQVHGALSAYASENGLTLSDAVQDLLDAERMRIPG